MRTSWRRWSSLSNVKLRRCGPRPLQKGKITRPDYLGQTFKRFICAINALNHFFAVTTQQHWIQSILKFLFYFSFWLALNYSFFYMDFLWLFFLSFIPCFSLFCSCFLSFILPACFAFYCFLLVFCTFFLFPLSTIYICVRARAWLCVLRVIIVLCSC